MKTGDEDVHSLVSHMIHGHSSLLRLIEELISHAELLVQGPEEPEVVLDELRRFASSAVLEFDQHLRDEELTLFPQLSELPHADLEKLLQDHRELTALFQRVAELTTRVERAEETGHADLLSTCQAIGELFKAHDRRERAAFGVSQRDLE